MAWLDTLSILGLSELIKERRMALKDKRKDRDDIGKTWTESKILSWQKHHDNEIKEIEAEISTMQAELDDATSTN